MRNMEKTFALKSAIPEILTNGRIAVYSTTDRRVSHMVIVDSSFEWENRAKQEAFRCGRCKAFILPDEKRISRDGIKYHRICRVKGGPRPASEVVPEGKRPGEEKEVANDIDIGARSPASLDIS